MNAPAIAGAVKAPNVSSDEALRIVRPDAEKKYRDLHLYRIAIALETDGWHIDFEFKDEVVQSGGPHYVVNAESGVIVSRVYEQ